MHASMKGIPVRPSIHVFNLISSSSRKLSYIEIKFLSSIEGSSSNFWIKCERQCNLERKELIDLTKFLFVP